MACEHLWRQIGCTTTDGRSLPPETCALCCNRREHPSLPKRVHYVAIGGLLEINNRRCVQSRVTVVQRTHKTVASCISKHRWVQSNLQNDHENNVDSPGNRTAVLSIGREPLGPSLRIGSVMSSVSILLLHAGSTTTV